MIPIPANLVQAILAIHLAMEIKELYAVLGKYLSRLFGINQFSCFLFNNESHFYSLDYSTRIETCYWDEIAFKDVEAPFAPFFDNEPLLFPTPLVWFGGSYDMYWALQLTHEEEIAAAIIFHEFPENMDEQAISLRFLMHHFTTAMVRTTIYCEMRNSKEEQASRLDLINEMGSMVGNKSLEPVLATLMGMALKIMHAEVGSILLYDSSGALVTEVEWGLKDECLRSLHFKDQNRTPFIDKVSSTKEVFLATDLRSSGQLALQDEHHQISSIASFPLYTPYKSYGLLNVVNLDFNSNIDEQKIDTLKTISQLAATTIENHHLHKKIAASEVYGRQGCSKP
ncbi:MAG: GAF domain-containing protein [Deltaproteobacteria bacterium]|nr:GAF domain-containing protein [Deltaproteobacteria bacterium]